MRLLEELTWPELDALDRDRVVVLIPFSPLEEHGPHLPIGTDLFMARHLAEAMGRAIETRQPGVTALLAPAVPLGAGTIPLRGSVNVSGDVVFDVARQIGAALARDGFKYLVFTNGHLGAWHLLALENAALWVSRRFGVGAIAPSAAVARMIIQRGGLASLIGDRLVGAELAELLRAAHGGMLETSAMLALRPELVRPAFADLPRLTRGAMWRWRGRAPAGWPGYVGAPAQAQAAWGALALEALTEAATTLTLALLARDRGAARRARVLPRVPFWLAARRWGMLLAATLAGAGVALAVTQGRGARRA